jgi:hypothetical protein
VTAARVAVSDASAGPVALCVTCLVRVGRVRSTSVLRSVVCGPCWAAHGGQPGAWEIGPAPEETVPVSFPSGQAQWLQELADQDWVQAIRADGYRNLTTIARTVAFCADWDSLESRPTWAKLMRHSDLERRSVARWLLELRLHGWLELLEHGSTPATRPGSLAHLEGNRAALYGLRLPLTPERALACASELLMTELATELDGLSRAASIAGEPAVQDPDPRAIHGPDSVVDQPEIPGLVDKNGTPSLSCRSLSERSTGGSSRARKPVDNSGYTPPEQGKRRRTALRAGSEEQGFRDLSIMVPVSGYEMLACADDLRRRHPVFGHCSRRLVRKLCKPLWRAGWCNRDILHAMDYRPSMFGQVSGLLLCPEPVASPRQFIGSRLAAWRRPDGTILPGYWTSRAAGGCRAREQVRARHGQAGARLLRAGEDTLTAARIAEHGRHAARLPQPRPLLDARSSTAADAQHAARVERDRHRAALVARARAELAASTSSTTDTDDYPQPAPDMGPVEGTTPYARALARARTENRPPPDSRRRYR